MSEKRFELDRIGIFDNKTNHFYYKTFDNEEVIDLLNNLVEENEQLRKELKELNRKYVAFSEATDKILKEMMK